MTGFRTTHPLRFCVCRQLDTAANMDYTCTIDHTQEIAVMKMKQIPLTVDPEMKERLDEFKHYKIKEKRNGMNQFIREAIEEKLEKAEREQARWESIEKDWKARQAGERVQ